MKIIKIIKEKLDKNETVVPLTYKPGDPEPEYPKFGHGMWRHSNPELRHLTDDEIDTLLKENSDSIQAGYIKSESWDKLMHWLKCETHLVGYSEVVLMKMEKIYTEVEKDYN